MNCTKEKGLEMTTTSQHPETIALHGGNYRSDQTQVPLLYQYIKQQVINLMIINKLIIYSHFKNSEISIVEL